MTTTPLMLVLLVIIGVPLAIAAMVYLIVPAGKGIGWLISQLFTFIFREIGDVLRLVGSLLTAVVLIPLTLANILIGRWSGASHFGRAIQGELHSMGACLYRIVIGHPARLLCLTALTEGIEKRIPEAVAAAPGADRPPRRVGQFDGYTIVGSLAGGGSGGKLYIAEPSREKLAAFARAGAGPVQQVVIKCFSLRDGSSLPQIVRENRALPAAKRLGLILEHELTEERFYYVMNYVPGESLGLVTQRLHATSGPDGLDDRQLREAIDYSADLARTLCHYHDGGLWHKDVKPDNIIVAGGQAHLVDFGLITPLRSSMTLTTHGTEYFRDPEMVRMALRGVKVHEVDGAKFDIYAAGAVLYSVIENSFPAHGGLSQISRRCPEAIRWIVRRAMTDYDKRYPTAAALLADLQAVAESADPFAVKPAMLPSFSEGDQHALPAPHPHEWEAASPAKGMPAAAAALRGAGAAGGSVASRSFSPPPTVAGGAPRLRVTSWWTGKYSVMPEGAEAAAGIGAGAGAGVRRQPRVPGATAAEQRARARDRAKSAQARAHARMRGYSPEGFKPVNAGVRVAVLALLVVVGAIIYLTSGSAGRRGVSIAQHSGDGTSRVVRVGPRGIQVEDVLPAPAQHVDDRGLAVSIDPAIRFDPPSQGQLMVLRDQISFGGAVRPQIDRQMEQLRESGFTLRGNHGAASEAADLAEDELIAELRNELGLTPFTSADARRVIQDWLDRYETLQALVWISRGDDAEPAAWVVGRRGVSREIMDRATGVMTAVEKRR